MNNSNSQLYKFLRSKSFDKRKSVFDFGRTLSSVSEELLPSASQRADKTEDNGAAAEQAYEEKLRLMEKSQNKRLAQISENTEKEFTRLGKQIQNGDTQNLELSESLRNAIERLSANRQGQSGQQSSEEAPAEGEDISGSTAEAQPEEAESDYEDGLLDPDDYSAATSATVAKTEEGTAEKTDTATTAVQKAAKKVVAIGDDIKIGENSYKITNTFGLRSGKNSVPGRSQEEHSRGMDIQGYSADGKTKNLPIALTDGEIVGITRHGDGSVIRPEKGKAGGYIMDIKMADGRIMKYMHLGKDVWENKAQLMNKKIKRGDILYQGDYSVGSGSQTGPHIKVSVTSVDSEGKQLRDYTDPRNDPKTYALYGNYVEEY